MQEVPIMPKHIDTYNTHEITPAPPVSADEYEAKAKAPEVEEAPQDFLNVIRRMVETGELSEPKTLTVEYTKQQKYAWIPTFKAELWRCNICRALIGSRDDKIVHDKYHQSEYERVFITQQLAQVLVQLGFSNFARWATMVGEE
jgi:hypothetical protein